MLGKNRIGDTISRHHGPAHFETSWPAQSGLPRTKFEEAWNAQTAIRGAGSHIAVCR
jgi:hypothetical protein